MSADALVNPYLRLVSHANARPQRPALKTPAGDLTYEQLVLAIDRYAEILSHGGLKAGHKVIVMVKPGLGLYALAFALFRLGAIPVIVDPGMGLKRILRSYETVEADALIGIPAAALIRRLFPKPFATVRQHYELKGSVLQIKQGLEGATLTSGSAAVSQGTLAFINFTTGSTGPAKAVESTHGMLDAAVRIIREQFDQTGDEVDLVSMPFFALVSLLIGSTVVIPAMNPGRPADIDPKVICETMQRERVTSMLASPALLDRLSAYAVQNNIRFPDLRCLSSGGAPLGRSIRQRCLAMLGPGTRFYSSWGATEGLPLAFIEGRELEALESSVIRAGRGMPLGRTPEGVSVRVIRWTKGPLVGWEDAAELPRGETGELLVHGANVSQAYYRNPEANAAHKVRDPQGRIWHRTGDLGWLDAEGRLIFMGRASHLVQVSGQIFHSVAWEEFANGVPGVQRSALVQAGPEAVLCVELDETAQSETLRQVETYLRSAPGGDAISGVMIHRKFPVDPRHNAKIERSLLGIWAEHERSRSQASRLRQKWSHLIPIGGWLYLLLPLFVSLEGVWLWIWWIDLFLSTVAHLVQIPRALPVGQLHGYTKTQTAWMTILLGATFWKPLSPKGYPQP